MKNVKNKIELKEEIDNLINNKVNYFSFTKHALDSKIEDDNNILRIVDEGKELINQLYGPVPDDKGRMPDHPHHGHSH